MNPAPEKLSLWSLERIKFLLAHIESFVESDVRATAADHPRETERDEALRSSVRAFQPQTDLTAVERLTFAQPNDPDLPTLVLERLAAFFDSGFLIQSGPARGWYVTDLFGRGTTFHLELNDQVRADQIVPELTPLQVHRATAAAPLAKVNLSFLCPSGDARAYLVRPTPNLCFVMVSNLAPPFAVDHVARMHELINKCFLF